MKNFDIDSLSFEELKALRESAEQALRKQKQYRIEALKKDLCAQIKAAGFTVQEVFSDLLPERHPTPMGLRRPATPKFFNPDDPSVTWSGRGKQPHWYREHLAAGKPLDDIRIKSASDE